MRITNKPNNDVVFDYAIEFEDRTVVWISDKKIVASNDLLDQDQINFIIETTHKPCVTLSGFGDTDHYVTIFAGDSIRGIRHVGYKPSVVTINYLPTTEQDEQWLYLEVNTCLHPIHQRVNYV